jgi:flagellar biosynthetic protein FlhB
MASGESGEKREKPTPRRRRQARERGQVARSRDLSGALALLAALLVLASQTGVFLRAWRAWLESVLLISGRGTWPAGLAAGGAGLLALAVGPAIAVAWVVAGASALAQGGIVIAPQALAPNAGRLLSGERLQKLFSWTALTNLGRSVVPMAGMALVVMALLVRQWPQLPALLRLRAAPLTATLFGRLFELGWKCGLVLLAWSGVDYLLERWRMEKQLRMSRQEVQEEFKETEGNPAVKARIRRLQRRMRRRRMLREVAEAAVVITNPTEYAIALRYGAAMPAPVVVAKGRHLLAREIRQLALWHGVPVLENPPLAHALYRTVEVGQSIPPKLYAVVAEVLAVVWRAQARAAASAASGSGRGGQVA